MPFLIDNNFNFLWLQTDTASVLLEAIGYIRFLQNQIEVIYATSNSTSFYSSFTNYHERQ